MVTIIFQSMKQMGEGVSPVIGTILLVAVTVTLITIISAVTLGMVGGFGSGIKDVGVAMKPYEGSERGVIVTILEGNDVDGLRDFEVYIDGPTPFSKKLSELNGNPNPGVGVPYRFDIPNGERFTGNVVVTGEFTDGTKVVLAKREFTFSGS